MVNHPHHRRGEKECWPGGVGGDALDMCRGGMGAARLEDWCWCDRRMVESDDLLW